VYVRSLQEKQKQLEKELKALKVRLATGGGPSAAQSDDTQDVDGVKLVARRVDELTGGDLRNFADELRTKIKSGVVVIGSATDGKVTLLTAVTKDLLDRVQANTLIGKLAPIVGGKGGGKPDLAQAGGKDPDKLNEALGHAPAALRELLGA
jgi:alanyl-tRNA synthetase